MAARIVDWIALSLLPGVGPLQARRALDRLGDPGEIAFRIPLVAFRELGLGSDSIARIAEARRGLEPRAGKELRLCERLGIRVVPHDAPDYPAMLVGLPDPPVLLYIRGELLPDRLRLAVVGSRACTLYGKRVATGLASGLAARGIEVVSGGARGIDTCSHRGALAEGGRTVAVVGSGLLRPYPRENAPLFEEIAENGAVLSEFGLEMPPKPGNFPRRNRLISALSAAVVVVEAARRSGSLSTASHALDQGREVLAVPGPVSSARSEGCNRLIQQGAKLVQNIEDILEELSPMYRGAVADEGPLGAAGAPPDLRDLSPDEAAVLVMLDSVEPVQLDELAAGAPFGVARLQAALLGLEFRGAVEQTPGRYYLLRPKKET